MFISLPYIFFVLSVVITVELGKSHSIAPDPLQRKLLLHLVEVWQGFTDTGKIFTEKVIATLYPIKYSVYN